MMVNALAAGAIVNFRAGISVEVRIDMRGDDTVMGFPSETNARVRCGHIKDRVGALVSKIHKLKIDV